MDDVRRHLGAVRRRHFAARRSTRDLGVESSCSAVLDRRLRHVHGHVHRGNHAADEEILQLSETGARANNTSDIHVVAECQVLFGFDLPSVQLACRRKKFLEKFEHYRESLYLVKV